MDRIIEALRNAVENGDFLLYMLLFIIIVAFISFIFLIVIVAQEVLTFCKSINKTQNELAIDDCTDHYGCCDKKAIVVINGEIIVANIINAKHEKYNGNGALILHIKSIGYFKLKISEIKAKQILSELYSSDDIIVDLSELDMTKCD